jgi:hypothetical protein
MGLGRCEPSSCLLKPSAPFAEGRFPDAQARGRGNMHRRGRKVRVLFCIELTFIVDLRFSGFWLTPRRQKPEVARSRIPLFGWELKQSFRTAVCETVEARAQCVKPELQACPSRRQGKRKAQQGSCHESSEPAVFLPRLRLFPLLSFDTRDSDQTDQKTRQDIKTDPTSW